MPGVIPFRTAIVLGSALLILGCRESGTRATAPDQHDGAPSLVWVDAKGNVCRGVITHGARSELAALYVDEGGSIWDLDTSNGELSHADRDYVLRYESTDCSGEGLMDLSIADLTPRFTIAIGSEYYVRRDDAKESQLPACSIGDRISCTLLPDCGQLRGLRKSALRRVDKPILPCEAPLHPELR